ncbi:MAG: hypothetical protein FWE54_04470 [Methanimicrococcus sp.]|nr:hypothetical protein [Methanimicrococcus sp.]
MTNQPDAVFFIFLLYLLGCVIITFVSFVVGFYLLFDAMLKRRRKRKQIRIDRENEGENQASGKEFAQDIEADKDEADKETEQGEKEEPGAKAEALAPR